MDPAQIMETVKSSFLFTFRTGNIVVDTLLTGLIIMLSTHLLTLTNSLVNWDFRSLLTWALDRKVAKIVITGMTGENLSKTGMLKICKNGWWNALLSSRVGIFRQLLFLSQKSPTLPPPPPQHTKNVTCPVEFVVAWLFRKAT
jgi:hypothetical protein